jgi:hypothetical protein
LGKDGSSGKGFFFDIFIDGLCALIQIQADFFLNQLNHHVMPFILTI